MDYSSHVAIFYFVQYTVHLATDTRGGYHSENVTDPAQFYWHSYCVYEARCK